jgi:hypothetical protein
MSQRAATSGNVQGRASAQAYGEPQTMYAPSGWTMFSSVLLGLAGVFGMINGLIAIIHDEVYVVRQDQVVAFDFTQWGWIHLIGGTVVLAAAFSLASGTTWSKIVGVLVASVHAIAQVAFIEAYPFWALTIIALDIAVIYGCLVHGNDVTTE